LLELLDCIEDLRTADNEDGEDGKDSDLQREYNDFYTTASSLHIITGPLET
jgi:hypothetical protein